MSNKKMTLAEERDFWQKAWQEQRRATGRAYWQGYYKGIAANGDKSRYPEVQNEKLDGGNLPEDG